MEVRFSTFDLDEIVAFTSVCNVPSIAVMKKLGMQRDGVGFEHPRNEAGSSLRSHVIYRQARERLRLQASGINARSAR